jgi:hypothetical protein
MRKRYRKVGDSWVIDEIQDGWEVGKILDVNHTIRQEAEAGRMTRKSGGVGSKDQRFVGRVPAIADAQWRNEWRARGGLQGTGMKATEYCLLKMSLGDHQKFIVTPSGRTGFERKARRKMYNA